MQLAKAVGVEQPEKIRLFSMQEIPSPENVALAGEAARLGLLGHLSRISFCPPLLTSRRNQFEQPLTVFEVDRGNRWCEAGEQGQHLAVIVHKMR